MKNSLKKNSKSTKSLAGFTLLEVLAALAVFLVGVVSVISLFTSGTALHQRSQKLFVATNLVEEVTFLVRNELPSLEGKEDKDGRIVRAARPVPSQPEIQYSYELRPNVGGKSYLLLVVLAWKEGGKERTFSASSTIPGLRTVADEVRRLPRR